MLRNISDLDLTNEIDMLYAFKNLKHYPDLLKKVESFESFDMQFGLFCFEIIENFCLAELDDTFVDKEMESLIFDSKAHRIVTGSVNGISSNFCNKSPAHADQVQVSDSSEVVLHRSDKNTSKYTFDEQSCSSLKNSCDNTLPDKDTPTQNHIPDLNQNSKPIDSQVKNAYDNSYIIFDDCPSSKGSSKITFKSEGEQPENDNDKFYIRNLDKILKPFTELCSKKIVDLIYYVYKRTGINHFPFLFRNFTEISHKIELHLLIAKALKQRPFDLSDLKNILDNKITNSQESVVNGDIVSPSFVTFESDTKEDVSVDDQSSEDYSSSSENNDPSNLLDDKPFGNYASTSFENHIEAARKLILEWRELNNMKFFFDNLAVFLSLKFDDKIFEKYLIEPMSSKFAYSLHKLPSVPYFFYQFTDIELFLRSSQRKHFVDPYQYNSVSKSASSPLPLESAINCFTLKYFLEYTEACFKKVYVTPSEYILIASSLVCFVKQLKHPAFFHIFRELFNCKISKAGVEIKNIILRDLSIYIDAFLKDDEDFASEVPTWSLKIGDNLDSAEVPSCNPSILAPIDILKAAYLNSNIYTETDKKISNFLLFLYKREHPSSIDDRREYLQRKLLDLSMEKDYKIYILKNIETIFKKFNYLDQGTRVSDEISSQTSKNDIENAEKLVIESSLQPTKDNSCACAEILSNLKDFKNIHWRYKKIFIQMLPQLQVYGIDKQSIIKELQNDKVFYIRNMIKNVSDIA